MRFKIIGQARAHEVTAALVTLMSLNEPGAPYDAAQARDLQDVPIMAKCAPDAMVWQEEALKTQALCPNMTPVLTRTGHQYRTMWQLNVINVHVPFGDATETFLEHLVEAY